MITDQITTNPKAFTTLGLGGTPIAGMNPGGPNIPGLMTTSPIGTVTQPQSMQPLSPLPQFSPGSYAPSGVFNSSQPTTAVQPPPTYRTIPQTNFPQGAIAGESRPY